jgi:hypothetical protein
MLHVGGQCQSSGNGFNAVAHACGFSGTCQSPRFEEATYSALGDIMPGDDGWPSGKDATFKRTCVSCGPTIRPTISLTSQPFISVSSTARSWSPRFICPAKLHFKFHRRTQGPQMCLCSCSVRTGRGQQQDANGGIPEALAGPFGAMPVMKTSPLAVMPKEMPMPTLSVCVTCAPGIG